MKDASKGLPDFQLVPIGLIKESPMNPRKHFDAAALEELAASIRQHGIITPLLGRPNGTEKSVELAAGHRRLRAAHLAGLTELPVVVRPMTDGQLLEVLTIENLQREDIHPIEEAEGYAALIERNGYTEKRLAERVGRSESYIAKRLALLNLIPELRKDYLEGKIELGHATLLARLQPSGQKRVLEEEALYESVFDGEVLDGKRLEAAVKVADLRSFIEHDVLLDLASAAWDKDDSILVKAAGACTACTKRTGANLALFDDTKRGDCCLDPACYREKTDATIKRAKKIAMASGEKLVEISTSWRHDGSGLKPSEYVLIQEEGKKPRPCAHKEKAIVTNGATRGAIVEICRTKTCAVHFNKRTHGAVPARAEKSFEEIWKDRRAALEEQIVAEKRRRVFSELWAGVPPELSVKDLTFLAEKLIDRSGHDGATAILKTLNVKVENGDPRGTLCKQLPVGPQALAARLVAIAHYEGLMGWGHGATRMRETAKCWGVDVDNLETLIEREAKCDFEGKYMTAKIAHDKKARAAKQAVPPPKKSKKAAKDRKRAAAGDADGE